MADDIIARSDIEFFVNEFYKKVKSDDEIGYIFTEIVPIRWDEHIPIICDFWETMLLNNGKYKRNPLKIHLELNARVHLLPNHFERWLTLFNRTIDAHFKGKNANLIKTRALSMANVIQIKIHQSNTE